MRNRWNKLRITLGVGLFVFGTIMLMMITHCNVLSETTDINFENTEIVRLTREEYIQKLSEMRGTSFEVEKRKLEVEEEKNKLAVSFNGEDYATLSKMVDIGSGQGLEIVVAVTLDVGNNTSSIRSVDEVNIVAIGGGSAKWSNSLTPRVVNIKATRFEVIYRGVFTMEATYSSSIAKKFEKDGFKVQGELSRGGVLYIGKSVDEEEVFELM